MKSYVGVLDPKNQKSKFTPVMLEDGSFPISQECEVRFNDQDFHIAEYFRDVPKKFRPNSDNKEGVTEHVHRLISHADNNKILIAIRLIHSPSDTKYLFLNELSPDGEMNFGYLCFRAIWKHLQIRDYNPEEPRIVFGDTRDYGKDMALTSLALDTLAEIGKKVYRSERLRNTYPYDEERKIFLNNDFKEIEEAGGKVWIREL